VDRRGREQRRIDQWHTDEQRCPEPRPAERVAGGQAAEEHEPEGGFGGEDGGGDQWLAFLGCID
jgi:hypothetical protein